MQCKYIIADTQDFGFWNCQLDEGHDGDHQLPSGEHCKTSGEWFH